MTGGSNGSTVSDASGNYSFTGLTLGNNYDVTPSKAGLLFGNLNINTADMLAIIGQALSLGDPLTGCPLAAADVNGDSAVTQADALATQRFFLELAGGTANVGAYRFTPPGRSYLPLTGNQTSQNYDALIFGDVIAGFVHRPTGSPSVRNRLTNDDMAPTVAELKLPGLIMDRSKRSFIATVTTSQIDAANKLVGFQGDFTFDERVVTFQREPVRKAGITSGNWNVSANVLPGAGPIRTLRISAYSNDFTPLSGSGTLFELRMVRVSKKARETPLIWAAQPNQFIFIDADLRMQNPGTAAPGTVKVK